MARYVDIDKAIEEARLNYCKNCNSYDGVKCRACAFDDAMLEIEDAPTADVIEVKYGQWKKHRDDGDCEYIECSVCREEFYPPNNEFEFDNYPKYCQECGAKMDLEEE